MSDDVVNVVPARNGNGVRWPRYPEMIVNVIGIGIGVLVRVYE